MTQTLLFLAFSGLALIALIAADYFKKVNFKSLIGLFLFGILISIPFVMVEHLGSHMKYYFVILAFIAIELSLLFFEHKIKYFHDLIHHNIKHLRILSFIIIGLGFTYSEISFTILHYHGSLDSLISILPFKTLYALMAHTVLTSAASLVPIGTMFSETIFETIIKLVSYYTRIVMISISHFLYVFSIEHNFTLLIAGLLSTGLLSFFYMKKQIDANPEAE